MAKCAQCGVVQDVTLCLNCSEPTCPDCKAGPSSDRLAAPFATYCSDDCRDGTHMRVALRLKDCGPCDGTGHDPNGTDWRGKKNGVCRHCAGSGKVRPEATRTGPMAAAGKELEVCPTCGGRYEFNVSTCVTCNGKGVVEVDVAAKLG